MSLKELLLLIIIYLQTLLTPSQIIVNCNVIYIYFYIVTAAYICLKLLFLLTISNSYRQCSMIYTQSHNTIKFSKEQTVQ